MNICSIVKVRSGEMKMDLRESTFQQMATGIKYFHRNEANNAIYFTTTIAYLLLLFRNFTDNKF